MARAQRILMSAKERALQVVQEAYDTHDYADAWVEGGKLAMAFEALFLQGLVQRKEVPWVKVGMYRYRLNKGKPSKEDNDGG